jgi:hypothetical protein
MWQGLLPALLLMAVAVSAYLFGVRNGLRIAAAEAQGGGDDEP